MANLKLQDKKFITPENLKLIVNYGLGFASRVKNLEDKEIAPFEADKMYVKDSLTIYDGYIYKAKVTNQSSTFNEIYWDKIGDDITELTLDEIKAMIGLTTEQLTTLSSIILDSEVRLDKTYSSSKIYSSIQDAIDTSKAYTLSELGKMSGASYKVVSVTSDMTDERIIYLLDNGTTFDMYIVENGTPTKIGDTNIDLSDYYTRTEVDNDFLKKTDATSTYATKTEANNKVDKTSILSVTTSTATDDNLYSAKLINGELNKKLNANELVVGDKGEWSALQCELTDGSKCYRLQIDKDGNANIFISTDNWSTYTFKRVCTTGVSDIPLTTITPTFPSTIKLGEIQTIRYSVKNGWANVGIVTNLKASPELFWFNIANGLPKPDKEINSSSHGETGINNASVGFKLDTNGGLAMLVGSEITQPDWWNINFSYPVAES